MRSLIKHNLDKKGRKSLPEAPGVYLFYKKETPIYIGKAVNLKRRVESYFLKDLAPKTAKMISEATSFSFIKVSSEIESLLLEAKLIRKKQPLYNVELKDDKHPLYIRITKEKYPRILTARKIDEKEKNKAFFGPFPSSGNVRSVLKMIRRIFPYATHLPSKKPCLYNQLDLCSPCPSEIENEKNEKIKKVLRKEYMYNINLIKKLLSGELVNVKNRLYKKMERLSKDKRFEQAAEVRDKIEKLDYITQPVTPVEKYLKNPNLLEDIRQEEIDTLRNILGKDYKKSKLDRIECFDVAHISGASPTASMVTFIKGDPDKNFYRHFKIRQKKGQDDISSMREVAKRRAKYLADWGVPDLIVVDGGKAQIGAFKQVFDKKNIPVIGLAKRSSRLIIPDKQGYRQISLRKGPAYNLVKRLDSEAHRFARRYHHKLLTKNLLPSN
jgi:excinuclease ABC subunit C